MQVRARIWDSFGSLMEGISWIRARALIWLVSDKRSLRHQVVEKVRRGEWWHTRLSRHALRGGPPMEVRDPTLTTQPFFKPLFENVPELMFECIIWFHYDTVYLS